MGASLVHYLLLLMLTLIGSSLQDEVLEKCVVMKKNMTVDYPGCESEVIEMKTCNGACFSSLTTKLDPPFFSSACNCCQPTLYKTKPRRMEFICDGKPTMHRIYLPRIKKCKCSGCTITLR